MIELNVLKDNSEIVPYNFPHFPVHATNCSLSSYPNSTMASHWHTDLEFITILSGQMCYVVNGTEYPLKKGQCILINSRQVHSSHSIGEGDCTYHCQLMHPLLFRANDFLYEAFIQPICTSSSLSAILLSGEIPWQRAVMNELSSIYVLCEQKPSGCELQIMSALYSMWQYIFENIELPVCISPDKRYETLSCMIGHVQRHYPDKITLHDIANAGNVCRSKCCSIFSELLNKTPIAYVTDYRLEKSIEMLKHTTLSITEIALQNGFNSSSYYTEVFHRQLGCTPTEYLARL